MILPVAIVFLPPHGIVMFHLLLQQQHSVPKTARSKKEAHLYFQLERKHASKQKQLQSG